VTKPTNSENSITSLTTLLFLIRCCWLVVHYIILNYLFIYLFSHSFGAMTPVAVFLPSLLTVMHSSTNDLLPLLIFWPAVTVGGHSVYRPVT